MLSIHLNIQNSCLHIPIVNNLFFYKTLRSKMKSHSVCSTKNVFGTERSVSDAEFTSFIEPGFVFLFRGRTALITCHNSF